MLLNVTSSRVVVRVDEREVTTHAEITLAVRRGQLKEFQLLVPPQATVRGPEGDDRDVHIEPARRPAHRPSQAADHRSAHSHHRRPPPALGRAILVGPFVVLGAFPQGGDILVTGPADGPWNSMPGASRSTG